MCVKQQACHLIKIDNALAVKVHKICRLYRSLLDETHNT